MSSVNLVVRPFLLSIPASEKKYLQVLEVTLAPRGAPTMPMRTDGQLHICIDVSGSMTGQKITDAEDAARSIVEQHLPDGSSVSVTLFSDDIDTIIDNERIKSDRSSLTQKISLSTYGGTRMHAALTTLLDWVKRGSGSNRRVVLLSDGHATDISEPEAYQKLASEFLEYGVPIDTIGIGDGHDIEILKLLSDGTRGKYVYITEGYSQVLGMVGSELTQALTTAVLVNPDLVIEVMKDGDHITQSLQAQPTVVPLQFIDEFPKSRVSLRSVEAQKNYLAYVELEILNQQPGIEQQGVTICKVYLEEKGKVVQTQEVKIDYVTGTPAFNAAIRQMFDKTVRAQQAIVQATQVGDKETVVAKSKKETVHQK